MDCRMHRGYLSSFQKQECLTRIRLRAHGPRSRKRPEPWRAWALSMHSTLRNGRKDRLAKEQTLKKRSPSTAVACEYRVPATGSTEKRPMLAEPGGLFPTPFPLVSPGECCLERVARASQVLEATGEAHGYREGVRAAVTACWSRARGTLPPGAASGRQASVRQAAGTGS